MFDRFAAHTKIVLSLFIFVGLGCDGFSPESKKTKHRERAASYFEKGQYAEALIEYKNVAQIAPNEADAHYRLALTYLKLGGLPNIQAAFAELSKTVELDKTNHDAQLKLGGLLLSSGEPAKARERAEIVLVSSPQSTEGLILKGRSLAGERRYREAIEELKKAIAADPKTIQTYIDLARVYFAANNQESAEGTLDQGLQVSPRSTELLTALGDFRATTGKPDQAELIFKQVLDIEPSNESALLRLNELYLRHNRLADADGILQKLAAVKPQDEGPLLRLGDFYMVTGQTGKALSSYQRAAELAPNSQIARDKLIGHYLDTGKTSEAETTVKDILAKNAKELMGRFFDARLHLARRKADDAIPILQGVIKDEPQFAGAHYFLGVAFMLKHQPAQARGAFAEAVKLKPAMPEARTALAELFLNEGSFDLALEHAHTAIQLNPRNIQAAVIAGDAYLRKGNLSRSKQVYEAIAKALPNEALAPYRLGVVAHVERNDPKALAYFEEALTLKPSAIEPLTQIALINLTQGKPDKAQERVLRQVTAASTSALHQNLLGQLWLAAKDMGQAETAFKQAIALDSSLLLAYMNLGQVYFQTGKTDQAVSEYEAVLAKEPQNIQAHMMLGITHERKKEYDKARARYERILGINPKFAPAANNLAWLLVEQGGNLDTALNYAQTAREQQPTDPAIADTMGWLYYKKHAYLLAISLLKEAVEKLPTNPTVQFHLGMAQYKNSDKEGAKKSLQTALKLDPNFSGSDEARKTLKEL